MDFDVIIIGGSYAGLQAAMTLGRALRKVLVIDSGKPCNRQTPHSHNFLTRDGETPHAIASIAREQLQRYHTVKTLFGKVIKGEKQDEGFTVGTGNGETYTAKKLLFTSGIYDHMPDVAGFAECWGISVIHCPYCHGYEVHSKPTGVVGNGDLGYEYAKMISNWSNNITLFTNGPSLFTNEQQAKLTAHHIKIEEAQVTEIQHKQGYLTHLIAGGNAFEFNAVYWRPAFKQHCDVPQLMGCQLTDAGYLKIDELLHTSIPGVYAAGDCTTQMRSVASAVNSGAMAGVLLNKELNDEGF
ncbi:Thioredoxin reductase [Mucilaginibacter pineti]|uniref:Thioredoxin reductase n=1 Tax=Mucilaginibacter pineti TaxID=1391627 RepID=A0A1G6X5B8_9SPHI|nr:NAD(P)/FAD-dependent oxidoreductase [Mucilaginibacter pineti]SDD73301.1 Thioredoxin reductase [Mucilaginibacter pineti]